MTVAHVFQRSKDPQHEDEKQVSGNLTKQGVRNLDNVGKKPGQPKRKPVELPPEEAWMTPGEGFRRVEQGEALENLREHRDEGRRTRRRDVSPD